MWRDEAYLLDIVIAARKVLDFTNGVDGAEFEGDEVLQNAVLHLLGIVGEAARHVSDEFRGAHPEVPWRAMAGLRNRVVHEYFRVDLPMVWEVVQRDIPELIKLIEPLLPSESGPSGT